MASAFHKFSTALEVVQGISLVGKNVMITGGAGGIGTETTRALASVGARVFVCARSRERAIPVIEEIKTSTKNNQIEFIELDLGSLKSVKRAADEFLAKNLPLNILINNAGIMAGPFRKTEDGLEEQFATNHLAHFFFTTLLLPALKASTPSRVVCLSSAGHKRTDVRLGDLNFDKDPYNKWVAYCSSKSANALFALELNNRFSSKGITAVSVHPGGIMTGLQKDLTNEEMIAMGWIDANGKSLQGFKSIEQGASTSTWAATTSTLEGNGGHYLEDCSIAQPATPETPFTGRAIHVTNVETAAKLWTISENLVQEKMNIDVKNFY